MYLPLESVTVVRAITKVAVLLNCAPAMFAVRRRRAKARMRKGCCIFGAGVLPGRGGMLVPSVSVLDGLYRLGQLAPLLGPLRLVLLTRAADGQGVRRDRLGDHRAGCHVGARAAFKRRDQRRVATDKCAFADLGEGLLVAIV